MLVRLAGEKVQGSRDIAAITALARNSHADDATVRDTIARLPAQLDHVDALVAGGTIGGERPNAADFQILAGVRVLCEFEELAHLVEGRPCEAAARRLFPDWTGPVPRGLPALS